VIGAIPVPGEVARHIFDGRHLVQLGVEVAVVPGAVDVSLGDALDIVGRSPVDLDFIRCERFTFLTVRRPSMNSLK
jgi:hypothetical protein